MSTPDRPFDEPWQAQLFALTVAMNEAGQFTWAEWSTHFGPRVQNVPAAKYWEVWSDALVSFLQVRGISEAGEIAELSKRWQAAARATPHGKPVALENLD